MWSSKLFWKLFLTIAGLNVAAAVVFAIIVSRWSEDQVDRQLTSRLTDAALLLRSDLAESLPGGRSAELQSHVKKLGSKIDMRITVVAMDGDVLADSHKASIAEVANMDNHKNRRELAEAASEGTGTSQRVSPTFDVPMRYYAVRADRDGKPLGLVRVALSVAAIQQKIRNVQQVIWSVAGLVSLAVLAMSYWLTVRICRPVAHLTSAADSIAAGQYGARVYVTSRDEIGRLGESFNHMSQELAKQVSDLRETTEQLSTVLGGMAEGVIALDLQQHILFANAAVGDLLAFDPDGARGRPLLGTIRIHALHEAVVQTLNAPTALRREIEFGEAPAKIVRARFTRLPGDPCPGVVIVMNDVTELRRLESLRQEFVANVSHELKTPLSSIKAYAETLRDGAINDPDNNLQFIERIEDNAERLHQLILDLLSLARVESGRQAFDIVDVSIVDVADACLADHAAAATAKHLQLSRQHTEEGFRVRADADGLREILDNLVDNAIKYTQDGGRVSISWRSEDGMCVIDVEDSGIGIAPDDQARLFERFYRVDKARSRELGGTGLGLAIVKHLTQSFGGRVAVRSTPGEGSTFSILLPRE
jgi:two-component system phosphate regulon sensor histidine kinase PhoR